MDDRDIFIQTKQGRFEYDPDFDYYRRVPEPQELTHLSQFGWVYICVGILAIAVYFR